MASFKILAIFLCGVILSTTTTESRSSSLRHIHPHGTTHPQDEVSSMDNEVGNDEQLALLHSQRVSESGTCEVPKLQVIHVSDHYPDRYYLPHCTLLHRCGKHAGCCGTDRLRCVAAKKEKVTLHFYSVRVFGNGIPAERKIEKLVFTNHTRCACVPVEHSSRHDL